MGFILRGFVWDIPILMFAYVPFLGPYEEYLDAVSDNPQIQTKFTTLEIEDAEEGFRVTAL